MGVNVYRVGSAMPAVSCSSRAKKLFPIISIVLWLLRNVENEKRVEDHPSRVGCSNDCRMMNHPADMFCGNAINRVWGVCFSRLFVAAWKFISTLFCQRHFANRARLIRIEPAREGEMIRQQLTGQNGDDRRQPLGQRM